MSLGFARTSSITDSAVFKGVLRRSRLASCAEHCRSCLFLHARTQSRKRENLPCKRPLTPSRRCASSLSTILGTNFSRTSRPSAMCGDCTTGSVYTTESAIVVYHGRCSHCSLVVWRYSSTVNRPCLASRFEILTNAIQVGTEINI